MNSVARLVTPGFMRILLPTIEKIENEMLGKTVKALEKKFMEGIGDIRAKGQTAFEKIKKNPHDLAAMMEFEKYQENLLNTCEKFAKRNSEALKIMSGSKTKSFLKSIFLSHQGLGIIITTNLLTVFDKKSSFWEKAKYIGTNTLQFGARVTPIMDVIIDVKEAWTGRDFFAKEINKKTGEMEAKKLSKFERGMAIAFVPIDIAFNLGKAAGAIFTLGTGTAVAQAGQMGLKATVRAGMALVKKKGVKGFLKLIFSRESAKVAMKRFSQEIMDIWTLGIAKKWGERRMILALVKKGIPKEKATLYVKLIKSSADDFMKVYGQYFAKKYREKILAHSEKKIKKGYELASNLVKNLIGKGVDVLRLIPLPA